MNTEKLLDAIGMLPNDLISETDRLRSAPRKAPLLLHRWVAAAACLVLVIAAGMACLRLGLPRGMGGSKTESIAESPREMAAPQAPAAMNATTEDSPSANAAPRAETGTEEELALDTHPMILTIQWSGGELTAQSGNFTLRQVLEDGAVSEAIACGAHPLQANLEPTAVSEAEVTLFWDILPDSVTARCWSAGAEVSDPGIPAELSGNVLTIRAEYPIYEITAVWGDTCTASYAVRLDLETQ